MFSETSIRPRIVQRIAGDWLAASPPDAVICIAIIAATQAEAEEKFSETMARWIADLNRERVQPN
jgi:hypothetical protein